MTRNTAVVKALEAHSPISCGVAGKRVLVLINCDQSGGVEHFSEDLIEELARRGAIIQRDHLYPNSDLPHLAKLCAIVGGAWRIVRYCPDITITFQPTSSLVASFFARMNGCPIRVVHQSNLLSETHPVVAYLDYVAGSLGFYTVVIANSRTTEKVFSSYPSSYRRRLRRIDHGIQIGISTHQRADTLAVFSVPDDGPIILCCARLVEQKCLDILISALPHISGARLVLAGTGPDKDRLLRFSEMLGVRERVHLVGNVARCDVFALCSACDVFAFPSSWETFGLAVVEAAMHGVPVVCRDLEVMREVMSADGCLCVGVFVKGSHPPTWACAINETLDSPLAKERAVKFAPIVRHKYSKKHMMGHYRALFDELMR